MGAAIGIGLASMGNAFMKSYNDTTERKRRQQLEDEDRAWRNEERDAVRQERAEKAQLKRDLGDAVAPRTTMTGSVTQSGAGRVFSATPENARAMQDTLAAEAEMRGDAAPTQQPGYAVTGPMTKGHQIAAGSAPEGATDTPDARNERVLEAYRKNGQFDKAATMESANLEIQAKRLNLSVEQLKYLKVKANEELMQKIPLTGNWWIAAQNLVTNSRSGPLADIKAESVVSEDGKTVEMFATGPDGKRQSVWKLPTGPDGWAMLMERNMQADLPTLLQVVKGYASSSREQANKDRDFELESRKADADINLKNAQAGAAGSKTPGGKLPELVKIQHEDIVKQRQNLLEEQTKLMADPGYDPESPAAAAINKRVLALNLKEQRLLSGLSGGQGATASADPVNLRSPAASAQAPAAGAAQAPAGGAPSMSKVSAQTQAARDRDRLAILQSELESAKQRAAAGDARAQGDVDSIASELARMGVSAAQPAAQPEPQAQPVATMASAQQPAATKAPAAAPVSMQAQAAPAAAPAPAPTPAPAPSVAQILAGPSATPAIQAVAQKQAVVIETAASQVKAAQAAVKQAAQAGNQAGIKAAMDQVVAASAQLKAALANMNPQQAAVVIRAVGLQ
jgi:hypothetical protein